MKFAYTYKKPIVITLVLIAVANLFFQINSYQELQKDTLKNGKELAYSNTNKIAIDLNQLLTTIEEEAHKTVLEIEAIDDFSKIPLTNFCIDKSNVLPELLGVTISFEPHTYTKDTPLMSIYYDKNKKQCIRLDTIYDYTDSTLTTAKWYTDVIKTNKPIWTKPYFGSGAKVLIADYSLPIVQKNKFVGVVTYTLSIKSLINIMHEVSLGRGGYGFLINKAGTIITHPNPEFVLKQSLQKILNHDPIITPILTKDSGFVAQYQSPRGDNISFCHQLLSNNNWKLITIFSPIDLFENNDIKKTKLINLFISSSIVVAILLFLFIIPKGISRAEAWVYSIAVTSLLIVNIGFVWYLNLDNQFESHKNDDTVITSKTSLNAFTTSENAKRKPFGFDPLIEIPTGIIVEKFKSQDSYNIGISGWIWQKYPKNIDLEPAIHFPQLSPFSEANYLQKFSTEEKEDYTLVKWQFRSTFIFNFNYSKYPFNTKNIKLKIAYPDYDKNVLFTPDLQAYESLNSARLPGISLDTKTTSSAFISSRFSFGQHKIVGDFDSKFLADIQSIPVLQFEAKTRKPFLNALIKQFIPIILVSLMIYLLLFNLRSNRKTGKQTVGIETVAGFLFILVLSHIDFRKTVFSGSITYLETFYFVIYIMIAFISINIVFFNLSREYFMNRKNNRLLKLCYWPFFFFTILMVTLSVFY